MLAQAGRIRRTLRVHAVLLDLSRIGFVPAICV